MIRSRIISHCGVSGRILPHCGASGRIMSHSAERGPDYVTLGGAQAGLCRIPPSAGRIMSHFAKASAGIIPPFLAQPTGRRIPPAWPVCCQRLSKTEYTICGWLCWAGIAAGPAFLYSCEALLLPVMRHCWMQCMIDLRSIRIRLCPIEVERPGLYRIAAQPTGLVGGLCHILEKDSRLYRNFG